MSISKRPRVDNMDMFMPRIIHFNSEIIVKIIWQLVKAKSYQNPYESRRLGCEDDLLWQMIIDTLTLPIRVSVEDLKLTVLQYYRIYQKAPAKKTAKKSDAQKDNSKSSSRSELKWLLLDSIIIG